ncbi:MAG: hypothetical protein IJ189_05960 [Clostridia bacterium]|nr:hypothetical protein [Clostridia bacterium]
MAQTAAENGVPQAPAFFRMTPREIHYALTVCQARARQQAKQSLLLARYMALAVHDPARLPDALPDPPASPMTGEQMKQRLLAWRRKETT